MKTIKCKQCGTEMSAMSEACPVCGLPTVEEQAQPVPMPNETLQIENHYIKSVKDESILSASAPKVETAFPFDSAYIQSVKDAFAENIRLQREHPRKRWQLSQSEEVEDFCEALQWYAFDYAGRVITNRPNIGTGFIFSDTQLAAAKTLPVFAELKADETAFEENAYFIECGADAEKAANTMLTMLAEVYKPETLPTFVNSETGEKFPKGYMDSPLSMMFCFDLPEGPHLIAIRKQLEIVNHKAEHYGHAPMEYVESTHTVKGYYTPADTESGKFLSNAKVAFQNGDVQGEITKLINLCFDALIAE